MTIDMAYIIVIIILAVTGICSFVYNLKKIDREIKEELTEHLSVERMLELENVLAHSFKENNIPANSDIYVIAKRLGICVELYLERMSSYNSSRIYWEQIISRECARAILKNINSNQDDVDYIALALQLPQNDVAMYISQYCNDDEESENMRYLMRVLRKRCGANDARILKRVRQVRAIQKYKREDPNLN